MPLAIEKEAGELLWNTQKCLFDKIKEEYRQISNKKSVVEAKSLAIDMGVAKAVGLSDKQLEYHKKIIFRIV